MKIIKVNVGEMPFVKEIDGSLKSMQNEVGGLIEMLMLEDDVCIICNEEGKINNLPFNRFVRDETGRPYECIAGDFFLCYAPPWNDDFESIPEKLIPDFMRKFS